MYICNIDSVHTYSYILYIQHIFCLDTCHASKTKAQVAIHLGPWHVCCAKFSTSWNGKTSGTRISNTHIVYICHIYIHTVTYRYIHIHYIYITYILYIYIYILYIYTCIYGPASGGPPLPPETVMVPICICKSYICIWVVYLYKYIYIHMCVYIRMCMCKCIQYVYVCVCAYVYVSLPGRGGPWTRDTGPYIYIYMIIYVYVFSIFSNIYLQLFTYLKRCPDRSSPWSGRQFSSESTVM